MGVIVSLMLIGFIIKIISIRGLSKDINFINEYGNGFSDYISEFISRDFSIFFKNTGYKNPNREAELYSRLIGDMGKAQRIVGTNGIMYNYHRPGASYMYKEYQLIVNTVNRLRFPDINGEDMQMVQNILIMTQNEKVELQDMYFKQCKNPFSLLRDGVNFIVTLPISILYWSGLMNYRTFSVLTNNWFMRFVNGLIILIGLISSIITIILGWEQTMLYVERLFPFIIG
jgi:hypothetical protein